MDQKLKKKTDELIKELKDENIDFNKYIQNNKNSLIEINLSEFWSSLVKKSNMSSSNIINKSDFSYYYYYEVVNGKKVPSKDKIVSLIIAMKLDLEDCQTALKYCGKSALYPKIKRDSIFIYAITHKLSLAETNKMLVKEKEPKIK